MLEQADEVIDQETEWEETEAAQEKSSDAETDDHKEQEESEQEGDEQESEKDDGEEQEGDDEIELFLGDEKLGSPTSEEEVKDTDLVKKLRKEIQDRNRELAAERAKNAAATTVSVDEELVKPVFDWEKYDEESYATALDEYHTKKAAQDSAKAGHEAQQAKFMELHNHKLAQYRESASKLGVKGFDEAEKAVLAEVPEGIQGAILHYADKPEIVVLAAGLNPAIRKQLAEVTDPVALGKLIGSIEAKAKLLPKSKQSKSEPAAKVKGSQGAGKQSVEDMEFSKAFPDAIIR
jgi:hypothetical protein